MYAVCVSTAVRALIAVCAFLAACAVCMFYVSSAVRVVAAMGVSLVWHPFYALLVHARVG